jgi:hypothetical protein
MRIPSFNTHPRKQVTLTHRVPLINNRKLDNGNQLPCAIAGSKSDDPLIVVPGVTSVLIVPVVDSMEGELAGSISAKINGFGDTVATSSGYSLMSVIAYTFFLK